MEALREMILAEDRLFLDAFRAVNSCPQVHLAGEMYKRPKFPDAKPEYQDWLNRKEIGVDYTNGEDFAPVLDGTFVPFMLKTMRQLAPLYRLLLAAKERADAAGRRRCNEISCTGFRDRKRLAAERVRTRRKCV